MFSEGLEFAVENRGRVLYALFLPSFFVLARRIDHRCGNRNSETFIAHAIVIHGAIIHIPILNAIPHPVAQQPTR